MLKGVIVVPYELMARDGDIVAGFEEGDKGNNVMLE